MVLRKAVSRALLTVAIRPGRPAAACRYRHVPGGRCGRRPARRGSGSCDRRNSSAGGRRRFQRREAAARRGLRGDALCEPRRTDLAAAHEHQAYQRAGSRRDDLPEACSTVPDPRDVRHGRHPRRAPPDTPGLAAAFRRHPLGHQAAGEVLDLAERAESVPRSGSASPSSSDDQHLRHVWSARPAAHRRVPLHRLRVNDCTVLWPPGRDHHQTRVDQVYRRQ